MTEEQRRLCEMIGDLARQAMRGDDVRVVQGQIDTLAHLLYKIGD
jgi:hypothetical protein